MRKQLRHDLRLSGLQDRTRKRSACHTFPCFMVVQLGLTTAREWVGNCPEYHNSIRVCTGIFEAMLPGTRSWLKGFTINYPFSLLFSPSKLQTTVMLY
jgi:hypothetical protein